MLIFIPRHHHNNQKNSFTVCHLRNQKKHTHTHFQSCLRTTGSGQACGVTLKMQSKAISDRMVLHCQWSSPLLIFQKQRDGQLLLDGGWGTGGHQLPGAVYYHVEGTCYMLVLSCFSHILPTGCRATPVTSTLFKSYLEIISLIMPCNKVLPLNWRSDRACTWGEVNQRVSRSIVHAPRAKHLVLMKISTLSLKYYIFEDSTIQF